jgi:sarcosine oxidase subunit alpha
MSDTVALFVDGRRVEVRVGTSVAAAILTVAGITRFRTSVSGEPRGPLCGMGVCFECRVTIDGRAHRRSCLIEAREGMVVETT